MIDENPKGGTTLNDLRAQLPECPLEYQVPHIPGSHTALVIEIHAADIDSQEKMIPWTLAGLINNTDIVMKGVHFYIVCEDGETQDRIKTALKKFDLPPGTITQKDEDNKPLISFGKYGYRYDSYCMLDINYWAFRGIGKRDEATITLPIGHVLRHNYGWGVADYSLHPANDILQKDTWVRMSSVGRASVGFQPTESNGLRADSLANPRPTDEPLHLTGGDSPAQRQRLANHLIDASERARWLHDANRAVYGDDYKEKHKNVAAYFFNEADPNWHLDASILQYSSHNVNEPYFTDWAMEWKHLGTEALIALYLLKTKQHAYNLRDSVMIESSYLRAEYPRLCNMQFAGKEQLSYGMKELMGAQLNIAMN